MRQNDVSLVRKGVSYSRVVGISLTDFVMQESEGRRRHQSDTAPT